MDPLVPTTFPELNAVLQELIDILNSLLDEDLVGAYLQGSFALGDYDQYSDVDFVIVTREEITERQIRSLQVMHAQIFDLDSAWAQHLDGSYFPKDVLRQLPQPDNLLWYLDNGSNELVKSIHCNTLVVRWVLREHGITLVGPPPETLVDPVGVENLREEIRGVINVWGTEILQNPDRFNNRFYQSFIVLSYCRMLHDLQAGSIGSKITDADWAKENLDPSWQDLIDRTWKARPNPELTIRQPAGVEEFERTLEFVQNAIEYSTNELSP
jgi:predicted nucleotidyltransferase